jgi:hypothetical protein
MLASVVDKEFRHNTGPYNVATSKRMIMHLSRLKRHGEMVLVERRSGGVKKGVDMSNGFVGAIALL